MRPILALMLLTLAACGATNVTLPYTPTHPVTRAPAATGVASVVVTDSRNEDSHYIGTIRGGFGNPIKTIRTARTTAEAVHDAVLAALQARGLASSSGDTLTVDVTRLDVNQMSRREAHADFRLTLNINGSLITFDAGMFASTDDLNQILVQTMDQAIDQMLDKPGFRAALGG